MNGTVGAGKNELPKVYESVSVNGDGVITVTLTNNSLESSEDVEICLTKDGESYDVCASTVVTGAMNAHNTFDAPENVTEERFTAYEKTGCGLKITLPKCSVVSIRLKK
jgi:alpha-N-arabinofuranosidase